MIKKFIILLSLVCFSIKAQDTTKYIEKYSINFRENLSSNPEFETKLLDYNFYFFSEQHNVKTEVYELMLFKYLSRIKYTKDIFYEFPVSLQYELDKLFSTGPKDTTKYDFQNVSLFNKDFEYFIRKIYQWNATQTSDKRTNILTIDKVETNQLFTQAIRRYFNHNEIPGKIKKDLKSLRKIKNTPFISDGKKVRLYSKFYSKIKNDKEDYLKYLGIYNYNKIKTILEGIELANYEKTKKNCDYSIRENFLFNNIINSIDTMGTENYISINGHFHTPLVKCDEWVDQKNWEPLAVKIKNYSRKLKVCSIYFMNRKDDLMSDLYFKDEKEYLKKNIPEGEIRLIQTNGENSPLIKIKYKYQYVLFW